MRDLLLELKKYLESNSQEKILKDWEETECFDDFGFKVCDLSFSLAFSYKEDVNDKQNLSSEFSSGFFHNYISKLL